ncbi:MAG: type IV secretion system protein TraC [Gammaproteobacteria bacterium]
MLERLSAIGTKISQWVGDKTKFGVIAHENEIPHLDDAINYASMSSLLPYEGYDPQTGVFHNKKSDGFVLEAYPLLGCNEEIENIIFGILTDILPNHADLQVLLWASPKIGEVLDNFEKERSGHGEIFEWLAKKRTAFLSGGAFRSLNQHDSYLLRNFRLIISASIKRKSDEDISDELISLREDIINSLKSIQMPAHSLSADEFINLMSDIIHPSTNVYPSKSEWNPYDSLAIQMTDPEYFTRQFDDKLTFENDAGTIEACAFTIKKFPKEMRQWKMTDSIGQLFNTSLQIPCPFIISLSAKLVPQENNQFTESVKSASKKKDANSQSADGKLTVAKEYQDNVHINQRVEEGDRKVKTHFQVILFSMPNQASLAERKLRDLYRVNGWELKKSRKLQLQAFLAMLPMIMSEGMYEDLLINGRLRTISALNVATILPFQSEWKGTRTPSLILPGRRGQIATYNPFDNTEGNFNIAIAAASGKGKSAFTQEYLIALLSAGAREWVIDVGRSYEKTCKIVRGEFIEFSNDIHICLNPFTHIRDFDSSLTLLKPLISAMAHPNSRASDEEITFIEKALKVVWHDYGNDATITKVAIWLDEQPSATCKNLSHLLYSFSKDGMYGRYFEGKSNIDLSNPFVVLELQELKSKKDLQRIVMLVLMYHISEVMYLGERNQRKSCIIDEAWDLFGGNNDGAAQFIETGYRTARRYNANFVTIVQSVNDYFKNATTIALFENSDTKIILGQTTEAIDQIKKSERLSMDAYSERLFKSLRKTDEYSECVIKTPSGLSVHRIILDPYFRILSSSKGEEFEAVKALEMSGLSLEKAVEKVAEKFLYARHR